MKVGSHDKNKVKDRDLMHTIGGADLYDDENMIELGITSFLNDRWRMVMSDALSSGSFPIQVDDEHHRCQLTSQVLANCLSACQNALESVREGCVEVDCWEFLEKTFQFEKRSFGFRQPHGVYYVGGARIGVVHGFPSPGKLLCDEKGDATVEVVVEMPSECFDDKDYLNHRYYAKRFLYLSHILRCLSKKKSYQNFGISFVGWCESSLDLRKPNLCMKFEGIQGIKMHIGTAIPVDTFPLSRLAPDRNNLRSHVVCKGDDMLESDTVLVPTPVYNSGIVEDMLSLNRAMELQSLAQRFPAVGDVIILLMAWAHKHGLLLGTDGLHEDFFFEIVNLVLVEEHTCSVERMHIFRGASQILANKNMFIDGKKGVFMPHARSNDRIPDPPSPLLWKKHVSQGSRLSKRALFVDGTGWRNLARNISVETFYQAQECAKLTTNILTTLPGPDALDTIFMQPSNPLMLFDVWCNCKVGKFVDESTSTDIGVWRSLEEEVKHVSSKALGDRAVFVRVLEASYRNNIDSKGCLISIKPLQENIPLCCRVHRTKCTRSVDIGPPANAAAAAKEFRQFWGSKSELRRFQDGKICESVVWKINELNKYRVIEDILKFILPRHTSVRDVGLPALSLSDSLLRSNIPLQIETKSERACFDCVTRLGKMLKSLDGVTLGIVNIQPVSAVHRNTALYPPLPHELAGGTSEISKSDTIPRCVPIMELLCQLEGSGRWPDAVAAYSKMKSAIGVQLALSLLSTFGIHAFASDDCVDVFYEGFIFRLLLYSDRDLQTLQKVGFPVFSTVSPSKDIPLRQSHQGLISSVAAENPSFKMCCRLAKLWIARQYLGNHINEEAVELVCAAAYSTKINIGGSCPASPELGFLAFLNIMAYHPWEVQPLVLDGKFADEAARLMFRMQAVGKAPAMFIVTPSNGNELHCIGWTLKKPEKLMLFRAQTLARKTIRAITGSMLGAGLDSSVLSAYVFSHSMKDYEVRIHFKKESLPYTYGSDLAFCFKNTENPNVVVHRAKIPNEEAKHCMAVLSGIPRPMVEKRGIKAIKKDLLIGFNPVKIFVDSLEEKYKDIAVVCTDIEGGCNIGLKIRPKLMKTAAFTPGPSCCILKPCKIQDDDILAITLNFESLAQDILSMGAGLVDTIEYENYT